MQFSYQLAIKIRDEIHDEVQRQLLSFHSGSAYTDAADRWYKAYGKWHLRDDVETFFHSVRVIIAERGDFYFRKMANNQQYLEELLKPESYYRVTRKVEDNKSEKVNESDLTREDTSTTGSYTYNYEATGDVARSGSLARGANTQTSQKNKGLENKWKNNTLLNIGQQQQIAKKEIDLEKVLEGDIKITNPETIKLVPPEQLEEDLVGGELYSTLNIGVTGAVSNQLTTKGNEQMKVDKVKDVIKQEFDHGQVIEEDKDITIKEYTRSNAIKDTFKVPYPNVYDQFFKIFRHLFVLRW